MVKYLLVYCAPPLRAVLRVVVWSFICAFEPATNMKTDHRAEELSHMGCFVQQLIANLYLMEWVFKLGSSGDSYSMLTTGNAVVIWLN